MPPLPAVKRRKDSNISVDNKLINSWCTVLYIPQINTTIHILSPCFTYKGPARSIPITSETHASSTLPAVNETGLLESGFAL